MAPSSEFVTSEEIRRHFNEGRYFERWQEGELSSEIVIVGPAPPGYPPEAKSQMIRYLDNRKRTVAICHQYADEYGNPVKETLPDPKYLFHAGRRLRVMARRRGL
jgi:hypothetical protein